MSGITLYMPKMQFVDANGEPYAFATAQFYLTGTTTPHAIYQDAALNTPLTNPVAADDTGLFPAIYLDNQYIYRMVAKNQSSSVTIADIDPVNALFSVGASDIEDGAIEAKLGYTPVDPANAQFTAPARMTITRGEITSLNSDDIGFRGAPAVIENVNYTLILDDSGCLMVHDDTSNYTWTIPNHSSVPFPVGTHFLVSVQSTGNITLHRDTDVSLRNAGDSTDDDVVANEYAYLVVTQVAQDEWVIEGNAGVASVVSSGQQSFTYGGTLGPYTHDFGVIPQRVVAMLVCTSADLGYSVGDTVPAPDFYKNGTDLCGVTVNSNTSTFSVKIGGDAFAIQGPSSTGNPNVSKWKLNVTVYKDL